MSLQCVLPADFVPAGVESFKGAADAFNRLSQIPPDGIDLGDGRRLRITSWEPIGDNDVRHGVMQVTIRGYIEIDRKAVS